MAEDVKKGLIIFARKPVLGKVKTRLAATIGDAKALDIYKKLLIHTRSVALTCECDGFAFLTEMDGLDFWNEFSCQLQVGDSLGDKMREAFSLLFSKGFEQCIIIGSDCPSLTKEIVDNAFENLKTNDVVIGKARDGGYYLLGMKTLHRAFFNNKNWSTENVFNETIRDIKTLELSFKTMPVLNDVDEEGDVPKEWL